MNISLNRYVIYELARIGGKSLKNMVNKIMKKVFNDKIQYKNNFSLLANTKTIFGNILYLYNNIGICSICIIHSLSDL